MIGIAKTLYTTYRTYNSNTPPKRVNSVVRDLKRYVPVVSEPCQDELNQRIQAMQRNAKFKLVKNNMKQLGVIAVKSISKAALGVPGSALANYFTSPLESQIRANRDAAILKARIIGGRRYKVKGKHAKAAITPLNSAVKTLAIGVATNLNEVKSVISEIKSATAGFFKYGVSTLKDYILGEEST